MITILNFYKAALLIVISCLIMFSCDDDNAIDPNAPRACFTISDETFSLNKSNFYSADCAENADEFKWYMGDGTIVTSESHNYKYSNSGTYVVSLVVSRNGLSDSTSQSITVEQPDVMIHDHEAIWEDVTWDQGVHEIIGYVNVVEGTLTIQPGTIIRLHEDAFIQVGGQALASIIAEGTVENPITFTSAQAEPAAGDWRNIVVGEHADNPSFKHCIIEYGGNMNPYDAVIAGVFGASFSMENCTIRNAKNRAIRLRDESFFNLFQNNTFENVELHAMHMDPYQTHTIGVNNQFNGEDILFDEVLYNKDLTLPNFNVTYEFTNDIIVGSTAGNTLTIEAGAALRLNEYTTIMISRVSGYSGRIIAEGTAQDLITFDAINGNGWGGFYFNGNTMEGTSLAYCDIKNTAFNSLTLSTISVDDAQVKITNCMLQGERKIGVDVNYGGGFVAFENNVINSGYDYAMRFHMNTLPSIGKSNTFPIGTDIWFKGSMFTGNDDKLLNLGVPYFFEHGFTVMSATGAATGAKLTIEPGVHIKIPATKEVDLTGDLDQYGDLVAIGTAAEPIKFTFIETYGASEAYWRGFRINNDISTATILDHCYIEGVDNGVTTTGADAGKPTITNCTFENVLEYGIYNISSDPVMENNTFINVGWQNIKEH